MFARLRDLAGVFHRSRPHRGASDFFLAVQFPGGSRHDLGLYEAILTAGIAVLFYMWRNKPVRPGFFWAFSATYADPLLLTFCGTPTWKAPTCRAGLTPPNTA